MLKRWFNKEYKIEKAILAIICIWIFFMLYYYDNQTAFLRIQDNMHRIFIEGKWYYALNGWFAIPYGISLQIACGIWSLPVFILSEIGIISSEAVIARIWYKIFIIVFLILDIWQLDIVASKRGFDERKKEWLKLFFTSSLLVMLPAVHIAQFDAIYLFFILRGINYYYEDKYLKFLICFMLAIPGKYMPLFIFIPLILLAEKRYIYIFRDVIVGCALILVDRAMYSVGYRIEMHNGIDPYKEIYANPTLNDDLKLLLFSNFRAFDSKMSIVVLLFALLCVWCYTRKKENKNTLAILVSFLGFSLLFAFGCTTPYWIILLVPFMLLLILDSEKYYNILLPLELIFSVGFVYIYTIEFPWIFGAENTFSFLIYSLIPGYLERIHGTVSDFIRLRGLDGYCGVMSGMMVATLLSVMILANPLRNKNDDDTVTNNEQLLKGWYWLRIAVLIGWILLNVWVVMLNHVN